MPPSHATTRKRRADDAGFGSEEEADDFRGVGPSRTLQPDSGSTARPQPDQQPSFRNPRDFIDLEKDEPDPDAEQLSETLQKQREDQVMSQEDSKPSSQPKICQLQCVICMDAFTDMTATKCGHLFCHECLTDALKASEQRRAQATGQRTKQSQCPICRKPLDRSNKKDLIPLLLMKKVQYPRP